MASLYELTEELITLDKLLEERQGDISDDDGKILEAWLKEYNWQMAGKIDAYAGLVKNWESDISAIKEERARLAERQQVIDNRIKRLKALAKLAMDMQGTRKLEGQKFTITIAKNGGVAPLTLLVDEAKVPEAFTKTETHPDMEKIRKALEANDAEAAKIAKIEERGESVRIK